MNADFASLQFANALKIDALFLNFILEEVVL